MKRLRIVILCWFSLTQILFAFEPAKEIKEIPICGRDTKVSYLTDTGRSTSVKGELLCLTEDAVYILPDIEATSAKDVLVYSICGNVVKIPRYSVTKLEIEKYSKGAGTIIVWTLLGIVSSVSHGWILIFTVPLWLIFGISSAIAISYKNDIDFEPAHWDALNKYSRFPQGLPEGFIVSN